MTIPLQIILVCLAAVLALGTWGLYEYVRGLAQRRVLTARGALDDTERAANSVMTRMDAALRKTELGKAVNRRIVASGSRMKVSTFLLLAVCGGGAAVFVIGSWMAPVFGVAAAGGVVFLLLAYLRRKEDRRREEFVAQLPELARVLSNATSAGLVMRTALALAAEELDDPARGELKRTADALRLGQPIDQALHELGERMPSRELAVLVSTLIVSARAGGSLVTALRTIAGTLEERKEINRQVKTIMGEVVVTNYAVGAMGVGGLVMLNMILPGSLRAMSENLVGQVILGLAAVAFTLSVVIIRRLTRVEV
ncbi:membrane protein [Actinomadura sp. NBRC 104412]|uniref:type II secretion system F family protein n=1 Tax=Actinomadura sp. NBRC 104412 TaxID=3032203 RepID=UPI0024A53F87|nr:type II secretion system F family protein [Actinomadura sp. NBRC 104412]GLZ08939.1 membrane protein [Actinomadura sp. NBRC 104412]